MLSQRLSSRFESALKGSVARGIVPFEWAASRSYRSLLPERAPTGPRTFSEKVRYKLIHDRRPIIKIYADKLAVRDYVRATCPEVALPRLLGTFSTEDEVIAGTPRGPWVMKASHGSCMNLICANTAPMPIREIRRCVREWLNTDYSLRYWEWQYFRLPKRILFEEYLGNEHGVPDDFKFYVIHQRVRFLEVDQGRFTRHTRDFYYPDWTPIQSRIGPAPVADRQLPKPHHLEEMIRIAEALACDTDFLRVDLYSVKNRVYFGELTHSPAAGHFNFQDRQLDEKLGEGWEIPARYR